MSLLTFRVMAERKQKAKPAVKKNVPARGSSALENETKRNTKKIAEIEEAQREKRSFGEKFAEVVANFCGSMTFVWVHVIWFGGWIVLNTFSSSTQFDPFPFTFLTLVVSLEAIFLSTFILISQNQETRLTERRNHLDLQINLLAEQESTKTLELLHLIATKVGVDVDDPAGEALLEPIEPGRLVEQIMSATAGYAKDPNGKSR